MNTDNNHPGVYGAIEIQTTDGRTLRFQNVVINAPYSGRLGVSMDRGFLVFEYRGGAPVYVPNVESFSFDPEYASDPWAVQEEPLLAWDEELLSDEPPF